VRARGVRDGFWRGRVPETVRREHQARACAAGERKLRHLRRGGHRRLAVSVADGA
jgi:hypothetical protein